MEESRIRTYSPLSLAFLGDAVYSLFVRDFLIRKGNTPVNKLSQRCAKVVSAKAQAEVIGRLLPMLTEQELAAYRRGKNASPKNQAKNATSLEYHMATGFESLIGWLYLKEDHERINKLLSEAVNI
ncbi:MAG: ribonuclease III [Lachnospiraceae bacterium]|nr:ribonuclease III [Lachnospiraceae bacterium]